MVLTAKHIVQSVAADGNRDKMPTVMTSEMPLPMPRSVICSPSHMSSNRASRENQSRLDAIPPNMIWQAKKQ